MIQGNYLAAIVFVLSGMLVLAAPAVWAQQAPHISLGPEGVLTAERQKLLLEALDSHGHDSGLSDAMSNALGITKGINLRELVVRPLPSIPHVYSVLPDGGLLLSHVDVASARNYRFDAHLRLVVAIAGIDDVPTVIPVSDAKSAADEELSFWADIADRLADRN